MKKFLTLLFCTCFAAFSFADTYTAYVNDIAWTYQVSSGEVIIGTGLSSPAIPRTTSGAITIPSTLGDYPVTSIGDYAFIGCESLTSVTIPKGVTLIGDFAFEACASLTSVTIPESVTSIGRYAFWDCSGLTSVTIPKGVTSIGYAAFVYCSALTSVTIPSSVTSIGEYVFDGCSNLKITVDSANTIYVSSGGALFNKSMTELIRGPGATSNYTIPSSVTEIGGGAFCGCSSLTSVTIPSSVTSIGNGAFEGCRGLKSVTIPSSVISIDVWAFYGCSGLTSVMFEGVPPKVGSEAFDDVASGCKGYYPSTYASEWEAVISNGTWNGLTMEISGFAVSVTVVGDGQVAGTGKYEAGAEVTLTAVPGEGSVFCGWSVPSVKSATYTFTMPNEPVEVIAYFADATVLEKYITANNLISKDDAKQALLDADEVFTADEMKEMAFGAPVMEVKKDVIELAISLQTAESLNAWQAMALQGATLEIDEAKGQVRVKVPKGDQKAAFYKFVVPEK